MSALRRPTALAAAASVLVTGLSVTAAPLLVRAATSSVCISPTITGVGAAGSGQGSTLNHHAAPGGQWQVDGSNLDFYNQSSTLGGHCARLDVVVGGITVASFTSAASNLTATSITFTPSRAVSGPLTVVLTDSSSPPNTASSNGDQVMVTDPTGGSTTYTPAVGHAWSASGSGFTLGGYAASASVAYTGASQGASCPGSVGAGVASDTSLSLSAFSSFCRATALLSETFYTTTAKSSGATASLGSIALGSVDVPATVGSTPTDGTAGSTVVVRGSGFGSSGSATLAGGAVATSYWNDNAVGVVMPDDGTSGNLVLTRADTAKVVDAKVALDARVDSVSPSTAVEGDSVTLRGGGFSPSGSLTVGGVTVTPSSWSTSSIVFTVPQNPNSGAIQMAPASTNPPRSGVGMTITVRITGTTPGSGAPGDAVEITGAGFGTRTGTVSIGGNQAGVLVWGDQQIVVTVPAAASPGGTSITVAPPGITAGSTPFTVTAARSTGGGDAGGSSSSTSSSGSSSSASSSATPAPSFIPPSADGTPKIVSGPVAFTRPVHNPDAPVQLTIDSQGVDADPGHDIRFSATLIAFGKPVAGAAVTIQLVVVPGADATVTPKTATTDDKGQVHGVVHLSKSAGDHILLVQSGSASDEIRLTGRTANAAAAISSSGTTIVGAPPKVLIMSVLVLCLVLFLAGFAIQMLLPRWAAAHAGGLPVTAGGAPLAPRIPGAGLVDASMAFASLAQFVIATTAMVILQLVARLRRRPA